MDRPDESLFEETKMSFGDHIEELRVRLFKAVIGIVIGFCVGLYFSPMVVEQLQVPLKRSISEFKARISKKQAAEVDIFSDERRDANEKPYEQKSVRLRPVELAAKSIGQSSSGENYPFSWNAESVSIKDFSLLCKTIVDPEGSGEQQTILASITEDDQAKIETLSKAAQFSKENYEFVAELMNGIVANDELFANDFLKDKVSSLPRYAQDDSFSEVGLRQHLVSLVYMPNLAVPGSKTIEVTMLIPARNETMATSIEGPFMIWLKTGFIVGLVVSAPWVFYQIWAFIAAGLYPHEKRYVHLYLPISVILFVSGAFFAFYVVFNYVLDFLFEFNATMGISPDPRVNEYIGFVMILPLGFGIAFQLPIVMVFLNRFGIISVEAFLSKWRIAILVIAIASMLLTPQDPISMALMALPLTLLYFVGIFMCQFMPRGRNRFTSDEVYDPS
jgi:sec-independent protein translocase protein TatC